MVATSQTRQLWLSEFEHFHMHVGHRPVPMPPAMCIGAARGALATQALQARHNGACVKRSKRRATRHGHGKLELQMLWLLQGEFFARYNPVSPTKLRAMRPFLKSCGLNVALRLGWHPFSTEVHFGHGSRLSGPKLVHLLQCMESVEFQCWNGLKLGFEKAPFGVRWACKTARGVLLHGVQSSFPPLPDDVVVMILKKVVALSYIDYATGPIGVRSNLIHEGDVGAFTSWLEQSDCHLL